MSPKIAIIGAMQREIAPMLKYWTRGLLKHGGRIFAMWKSGECTYIQSGMGKEPAMAAARAALEAAKPEILISAGFAGALTAALSVGEVVVPEQVVDGVTGKVFVSPGGTGILVSAPMIADEASKRKLAQQFKADLVDMEAAAVGTVAEEHKVLFCAVKAISDELGFAMPPFNTYVKEDGTLAIDKFAAHVAVRPGYWPSLMQLARNSKKASLELSSAVVHLVKKLSDTDLENAMRMVGTSARAVN
ncbi:MAG TPA: hypothetical protein VN577_20680 [Terriglobales bacterium]|nr:hypothetical protein [Terriglobales bacterium]